MTPFTRVRSVAAPMPEADIDTDIIFPARFLLRTEKRGLGGCAFFDRRFTADGSPRPAFVLNREPWRHAEIIVAGANFGCGSSREQAPWALADLGVRCLIAPGFGEIFRANCYANGMLPIVLGAHDHARVLHEALAAREITVDLNDCVIAFGDAFDEACNNACNNACGDSAGTAPIAFEVPARQRAALLAGLDEIDLIRRDEAAPIATFEQRQRLALPWLFH